MKLFSIIFLILSTNNYINENYKKLVDNNVSLYEEKKSNLFRIKIFKFKRVTIKLEKFILKWKNKITKWKKFDHLFQLIKEDDDLLTFFYSENLKSYISLLNGEIENLNHKNEQYYYLHGQLIFFKNKKNLDDDDYYYYPYWNKDEAFDKFKEYFENILFEKTENDEYDSFLNQFHLNINYKKLIKKKEYSKLDWFYSKNEIFSYPIIFNYNFLPKINSINLVNELTFYNEFYKENKNEIKRSVIFSSKGKNYTLQKYKNKKGIEKLIDNFLLFNNNLISIINEFIILNSKEELETNKIRIFNFHEDNVFINKIPKNKENNYYDSISKIFKISFNNKIINIENKDICRNDNSCYFSKLFINDSPNSFDFIVKYYNIYYLFYEAKLFGFNQFFLDLKKLIDIFSDKDSKLNTKDRRLNKLINKILYEFDLNNLEEIRTKIKYLILPILKFFINKIKNKENNEKLTLRDYFEDSQKLYNNAVLFTDFLRKDDDVNLGYFKDKNFVENYKSIKNNHEINYFILYNILFKTFMKSFDEKKNSFFYSLKKMLLDKKDQIKYLIKDVIKFISFKSSFKEKIQLILKNIVFIIELFDIYDGVFNLGVSIIENSVADILDNMHGVFESLKDLVSEIQISKIIFNNFNKFTISLFKILNGNEIKKNVITNKLTYDLIKKKINSKPTNQIDKKSNIKISFSKDYPKRILKRIVKPFYDSFYKKHKK